MKNKKIISILVICIVIFSLVATTYGIFSNDGFGESEFESINDKIVNIYGEGLYKNDSVAMANQAIAQDIVTIIVGIPLLIISLLLSRRDSLRGRLLLTGTLAYFFYTYTTYTFIAMYNSFFLIYVILMGLAFFALILNIITFNVGDLKKSFNEKLPVKFLGGYLIFITIAIAMLWFQKILPMGSVPDDLDHYTSMVIQGFDLGIVIPSIVITSILLIRRNPYGYLFTPIFIIKSITLLTALTAMVIGQIVAGIELGLGEIIMFPIFNLIAIYCLFLVLKNVKKEVTE